jgi:hypothetical protein
MRRAKVAFEDHVFHSRDSLFLVRLAREYEKHDPLQLLCVELVRIECEHPLDDDLALVRVQNSESLQCQKKPPALRRKPRELSIRKYA